MYNHQTEDWSPERGVGWSVAFFDPLTLDIYYVNYLRLFYIQPLNVYMIFLFSFLHSATTWSIAILKNSMLALTFRSWAFVENTGTRHARSGHQNGGLVLSSSSAHTQPGKFSSPIHTARVAAHPLRLTENCKSRGWMYRHLSDPLTLSDFSKMQAIDPWDFTDWAGSVENHCETDWTPRPAKTCANRHKFHKEFNTSSIKQTDF